nr:hypothetical protein [Candidatus Sigynarchaeota archaeon]
SWISTLEDLTIVSVGDDVGGNANVSFTLGYYGRLVSADYENYSGPIPAMPVNGTSSVNVSSNSATHVSGPTPTAIFFINVNAQNKSWVYGHNASGLIITNMTARWNDKGALLLYENISFNNSTNITTVDRIAMLVPSIPGFDIAIVSFVSGISITISVVLVSTRKRFKFS